MQNPTKNINNYIAVVLNSYRKRQYHRNRRALFSSCPISQPWN